MKTLKTYGIKASYQPRAEYTHFDDTPLEDEWQREVYLHAKGLMAQHGYRSVMDVGCGSGYKLVHLLGEFDTLGLEVSPTYEWLLEKYPDRRWMKSDFDMATPPAADLVICADVIEHLLDPDELLRFISRVDCKLIVLSTPDRNLFYPFWNKGRRGPPDNECHIREWSFREFRTYIRQWFEVTEHLITNRAQSTQMIVCHKRLGG